MKSADEPAAETRSASAAKETFMLRSFSFFSYTTTAVVVSYFPLYFLDRGFTEQQIGIIYSTGPFISIFANLLTGMISDKYRTIKKLLMLLLLGQLAMIALLFPLDQFALICAAMIGFYFFQTPINPLTDSLILLSVRHTGVPFTLVRIFGSLGFASAALLLGLLLKEIGSEWTLAVALATIGIAFGLSALLKDYSGSLRKIEFSGFFRIIRQPDLLIFFTLVFIFSVVHRLNEGFLAVMMRQMGASDALVGAAWMISAVSEIPVFYLLGKYGHKFRELPLLFIASLLYALRFLLLGQVRQPEWFVVIQAMHSVTFGIYYATALRYLSGVIPDEYRSSGLAVYTIVWAGFAGIASGIVGGYVYQHFGRGLFFDLGAALALIAAAGFLAKHWADRRAG
mgnify:CR=1 FL=1